MNPLLQEIRRSLMAFDPHQDLTLRSFGAGRALG